MASVTRPRNEVSRCRESEDLPHSSRRCGYCLETHVHALGLIHDGVVACELETSKQSDIKIYNFYKTATRSEDIFATLPVVAFTDLS